MANESGSLFRSMKKDGQTPAVGVRGGLHIRPGHDVDVVDGADIVGPGDGGLSTVPGDYMLLQASMRPRALGGTGRHPVWVIDEPAIAKHALQGRYDTGSHVLIESAEMRTLNEFEQAIRGTANDWSIV